MLGLAADQFARACLALIFACAEARTDACAEACNGACAVSLQLNHDLFT